VNNVVTYSGIIDGTVTELIDPPFGEGTLLVTQAR